MSHCIPIFPNDIPIEVQLSCHFIDPENHQF